MAIESENLNPEENREESRFKTPPIGEAEESSNETEKRAGPSYSALVRDFILGKKLKKEKSQKGKKSQLDKKEALPEKKRSGLFGMPKPTKKDIKEVEELGILGGAKSIQRQKLTQDIKSKSQSTAFHSEIYKDTKGRMQKQDVKDVFEKRFGKGSLGRGNLISGGDVKGLRKKMKQELRGSRNKREKQRIRDEFKIINKFFPEKKRGFRKRR